MQQATTNATQAETSSPAITGDIFQGARVVNPDITVEELIHLAQDPETLDKIKSAKEFKFIVIGLKGTGKSTLINGLIGAEVAKVEEVLDLTTEGVTEKVESYSRKIDDIEVVAYDSPGLEHGSANETAYLEEIYQTCQQGIHLVVFAVPLITTRFIPDNPHVNAMVKFTRKLTPAIWNKALVVLTCANMCETMNPLVRCMSQEDKKKFFKKLVNDYKAAIHQSLKTIGVPAATVKKVKVVPVGIEFEPKLLDGTLWFSNFWFECLTTIPSAEGPAAMTQLNRRRFMQSVTVRDFELPLYDQPIFVDRTRNIAGTVTGYVATGAALGALGFIAGPVGIVPLPVGLVVGAVLGATAIR